MSSLDDLSLLAPQDCLRGAWCNSSPTLSAVLEAVSFVTPALEAFFIVTVRDLVPALPSPDLRASAAAFIHEEATHAAAHRRLNAALEGHLQGRPAAVGWIVQLLRVATGRLGPDGRLLLVETLELATWLGSVAWIRWEHRLVVACPYARTLFSLHAREELHHVRVLRAFRPAGRRPGLPARALARAAVAGAAVLYLVLAVPWIAWRKRRLRALSPEPSR